MYRPITYDVFKELFKLLGINPLEFRKLSGDNVMGYFPDLPEREPKANVQKLAEIIWNGEVVCVH